MIDPYTGAVTHGGTEREVYGQIRAQERVIQQNQANAVQSRGGGGGISAQDDLPKSARPLASIILLAITCGVLFFALQWMRSQDRLGNPIPLSAFLILLIGVILICAVGSIVVLVLRLLDRFRIVFFALVCGGAWWVYAHMPSRQQLAPIVRPAVHTVRHHKK
jgi:Flp pilus assembly protein TadB